MMEAKLSKTRILKKLLDENAEDAKVINVNADKEEEEQVTDGKKIKKEKKVKKEAMDEQVEMDGDEFKANSNGEGEEEKEEDEDEGKEGRKKHKKVCTTYSITQLINKFAVLEL
ncbi:hypothetical protein C0989_011298 [Termitomyces sp. Mn162]|nr:hypothetical protein C0989_011298 [Termitomyces sp. Mn162]